LVVASVIVPLVQLPQMLQSPVKVELIPEFSQNKIQLQNISEAGQPTLIEDSVSANEPIPESNQLNISLADVLLYVYLGGAMLSLLLFASSILMVLLIFRKATVLQMEGYRLFIIDREIPSFAFGSSVVISRHDYELHGDAILAHEQAHIRLNHFYDLILLELVKIFHWFNPAIYLLTGDMKEIHEFQADAQTVGSGVDSKQYQLLIIQKGVGSHRFALANSFNHCQIKKRIIMMNKSKTSKAWRWKVATFLPLLALLLMAFGKAGENSPPDKSLLSSEVFTNSTDSVKQWTEADFKVFTQKTKEDIFFKGMTFVIVQIDANSKIKLDDNSITLDEIPIRVRKWMDYNFAEREQWIYFKKETINGKTAMSPMTVITIRKDSATQQTDYLKLLNVVANTILKIRDSYSKEIFGSAYSSILLSQRNAIDKLIPMNVSVTKAVIKKFETAPPPPPPSVWKEKVNTSLPPPPPPPAKKGKANTLPPPPPPPVREKTVNIPPPPPPPKVIDISILISIAEDAYSVKQKVCTFDEIEKMVNDINPKKEFVQIVTRSTSSKELQSSLKELLEKKGISYQISWTK